MKLMPDYYFRCVADIPPAFLVRQGIRGLVLDIDNTLAHDDVCALPGETDGWLKQLAEAGIGAVIVSNNREQRACDFSALCGLPYVAQALKPAQQTVPRVLEMLRTAPDETAVVGDQLFTDISYGKAAGFVTILVEPLGDDNLFFVRFKRLLERPLLRKIRKRGVTRIE